jgi:hypothetical protein
MTGANAIRSAAIVGVVGASLALAACSDDKTGSSPIRPVLSVVARSSTTQTIGPFAGSIEPRYTVVLGFQVFGRLISATSTSAIRSPRTRRSPPSTPRSRRSRFDPPRRRLTAPRRSSRPCRRPKSASARCSSSG